MKPVLQAALLCTLGTALGQAASWSGALVDARCYTSTLNNVNPRDNSFVSTDKTAAIRGCPPNQKTRAFVLVQRDGWAFNLDAAGNKRAKGLILTAGKQPLYSVEVIGERNGETLAVTTISIVK